MIIISNTSSNHCDVKTEPDHVFHDRRVMYDVDYISYDDDPRMLGWVLSIRFHHYDDNNVCKGVRKID